ncbi:dehydrogenase [candidate division CSSED10-310 bacterium]|uniref:Dehydrogenase n=1 Tax=candidate division CSSED10-310 bacterium TaxID=2855610 RepID=A0ABV6YZG8_UNCC1
MRHVISISFGKSDNNYEFDTTFMDQKFHVQRIGTDGDSTKVFDLLEEWKDKVDAIGIGGVSFPSSIGMKSKAKLHQMKLQAFCAQIDTPVTTGENLRNVAQEWVLRYVQFKYGGYFNNARVLFLSGMINYNMAKVMSLYTDNLTFADPVLESGIPKFLKSLKRLETYAETINEMLQWTPATYLTSSKVIKGWNDHLVRKAMQKNSVIVVPYYDFYNYLAKCTLEELGGKIVITATAYDDRIEFLKERGVDVIIDPTPKVLEQVVGVNVLEALIIAASGKTQAELTHDDFLEIISELRIHPRVIYPSGEMKRKNRFAFVIHPLSQENLKKDKTIKAISEFTSPKVMNTIEKVMAYSPPFMYSKVSGIKSPTGVEVEGWLITIGGTPKQMLSHKAEFTYRRLLSASRMAKRMGAQIMGLGAFTKVVGDAGVTVAKLADIPITTGNSYSASGALWAAADAARRMGLIKGAKKGKKLKAKSMVVGATGAIGSVCSRLLAMAFEEVYMVDIRDARLLALKESILQESPDTKIHISTRADRYLADMDVIVTATSSAGKKILDIMKVKPGCIITDVARPLDLSPEDVAKRPDVLVIESGEILLPGEPILKDIGLPPGVAFACMAETIVLALEGRFEVYTIGREIEWQKVKEIYTMGLKHGMKLAAISGVNGVYSDEDIARVKELALEARQQAKKQKSRTKKAS